MSPRTRTLVTLLTIVIVLVAVPLILVGVATRTFGSWWPMSGWDVLSSEVAPGAWLADTLVRLCLLAGWVVVVGGLVGLAAEVASQVRHGMPSTPRHDWLGARVVRHAAAGLLAAAPVHQLVPPLDAVAQAATTPVVVEVAAEPSPVASEDVVVVTAGDSVWSIAERVAGGGDVAAVAEAILDLNLGRVMVDGDVFATPALIHPGWQLQMPGAIAPAAAGTHVVRPGESYWSIAAGLSAGGTGAEVADLTTDLVALNAARLGHQEPTMLHPGDILVTVPTDVPPPDEPVVDADTDVDTDADVAPEPIAVEVERHQAVRQRSEPAIDMGVPAPAPDRSPARQVGLGMLAIGLLGVVAARRLTALRGSRPGLRPVLPDASRAAEERHLRRLADAELVARVDLVVRAHASRLQVPPVAVVASPDGSLRVWTDDGVTSPSVVSGEVTTEELIAAVDGGPAVGPSPALVQIGASADGALFVDLEQIGALSLDLPMADVPGVATHLAAALATSPFASAVEVRTVGLGSPLLAELGIESSDGDRAVRDLVRHSDALVQSIDGASVHAARAGEAGDSWEPFVVVAAHPLEAAAPLPASCVVAPALAGRWRLAGDRTHAVLQPLGIELVPSVVDATEAAGYADLLAATQQFVVEEPPGEVATDRATDSGYDVLVRTFGQVEVVDADGIAVRFEKQKSLELVVWMSLHRRRSTRSAARDALWSVAVRDATFANVVSDARRSMARAVPSADDREWIARTLTDELALHPGVVCDIDLLSAITEQARRVPVEEALEMLRRGLELVAGLPFAGTAYAWTDAEGLTSAGVLAATTAACEMAERCLQIGDVEGVFWATGQGLQVLPGHEELIAYRMRAHAAAGDRAGVRAEWESYERAVLADPWSDGAVAPKLVSLRTELLTPLGSAR